MIPNTLLYTNEQQARYSFSDTRYKQQVFDASELAEMATQGEELTELSAVRALD